MEKGFRARPKHKRVTRIGNYNNTIFLKFSEKAYKVVKIVLSILFLLRYKEFRARNNECVRRNRAKQQWQLEKKVTFFNLYVT